MLTKGCRGASLFELKLGRCTDDTISQTDDSPPCHLATAGGTIWCMRSTARDERALSAACAALAVRVRGDEAAACM